jgi:hypothetical protein
LNYYGLKTGVWLIRLIFFLSKLIFI